jgi:hypothetical protein
MRTPSRVSHRQIRANRLNATGAECGAVGRELAHMRITYADDTGALRTREVYNGDRFHFSCWLHTPKRQLVCRKGGLGEAPLF